MEREAGRGFGPGEALAQALETRSTKERASCCCSRNCRTEATTAGLRRRTAGTAAGDVGLGRDAGEEAGCGRGRRQGLVLVLVSVKQNDDGGLGASSWRQGGAR